MSEKKKESGGKNSQNSSKKEVVRLLPLGGLDEDGKNLMIIEIDGDIYIAEAGLKFPTIKQALGIECIIPDFSYLIEHKDRIKAIIITHGHDDVMGALPYLLAEVKADVYTTEFTARILGRQLNKSGVRGVKIRIVNPLETKRIGGRPVTFFPLTHSFPQAFGFGVRSKNGWIVYTGEFIEDYNNVHDMYRGEYSALSRFHNEGVLVLMQDSKGSDRSGHTSPSHRIGPTFRQVLENYAHKRIFVTCYTQSVFWMEEMLQECIEMRRPMCFYTRECQELIGDLQAISPQIPDELVISVKDVKKHDNAVIFITGQGRNLFKLMINITNNEESDIRFEDGDIVAACTQMIPGVEKDFGAMENDIYKREGTIIRIDRNAVGMHPAKEDLKMAIYMTTPDYYMPIKGEYRMLCANAMIALEMGIPDDRILILDNGQIATFVNGELVSTEETMELHDALVDGKENWDQAGVVLKDREILSTDGVMVLAIGLDSKTKKIVNGPDVQTRGLIYLRDAAYITKDVAKIMEDTIEEMVANHTYENMEARGAVRDKVVKYLQKETGKRPMVLAVILEITPDKAADQK